MLDRPPSAERHGPGAGAAPHTPDADASGQRVLVAALDDAPQAADFDNVAGAAGLDGNMLSAELAQLMRVPVLPEPVSGERAVIPFSPVAVAPAGDGGDPQLLLSALTGVGLSDLMNLSVYSDVGLLQELDALHAAAPTNPFAAEFLHNMMSLPLPDLMSVGPLQNLLLTDYAHHPGNFDFVWNMDRPKAAGALPSGDANPSDHHPEQAIVDIDRFAALPRALFTAGGDTVVFDTMSAGQYAAGNWHDALGGDDYVVLPSSAAVAAALGYDPAQSFTGSDGNDTIVAGGLADAIDGGSGVDAVSYANSGAIVVLLQDTDTHGPHASELAGGSGGYAAGDSYTGIETLIASPFDDYVFGSASGGTVNLSGGNGDDTLVWRDADTLLSGDAGTDTLRIAGGNIDLGSLAGVASSIERIDLATDAAANAVTLTASDVINLSGTDILTVTGTAADSVNAGSGWTDGGLDGGGNHVFTKLVGPTLATLVVNQDVTVNADITS
jgi:hypothetical protein